MEQGKKNVRQRFNVIDVLLILILAVLAILIFFTVKDKRIVGKTTADADVFIEVEISPVYEEIKSLAEVGSNAYDVRTGDVLGELTDVSYSDYYLEGISEAGERVRTRVPGMASVTLTLRAKVRESSSGYLLNGSLITINDDISLRTPSFSGAGKIVGINSEETEAN